MDRRTDRTIGIAMIIAVALVPTATLALVEVGGGFDAGRPAETAVTPVAENYPGAPKPPPTPTQQPPAAPIALPDLPDAVDPGQPVDEVPEAKPLPAQLSSFTRQLGMVVAQADGTTNSQEVAKFTLKPKFSMDAKTTEYVLKGKKWRKTGVTQVVIRNGVKATRTPDGEVERERLTPEEIDQLRYEADPRTLTRNVKNLPGIQRTFSRKTKFYRYTLAMTSGATLLESLPEDIRALVPPQVAALGLQLELYADDKDHAFVGSLTGATPISATGIGVIYSDMK